MLLLRMAVTLFSVLEELNRSLQSRTMTVSGMIEAVGIVKAHLLHLRTDREFSLIFENTKESCVRLNLCPIELPRQRRPAIRYCGVAPAYAAKLPEEHYRAIFFELVDAAATQLHQRFDANATGLSTYLQLEEVLLNGAMDNKHIDVIKKYPELSHEHLAIQLAMFRSQMTYSDLRGAVEKLKTMTADVRSLFPQVERLTRLLLVCPVSACEAERSFSALRRLKTWLRNSISQSLLNSCSVPCASASH